MIFTDALIESKLPLIVPLASGLSISDTKRQAVQVTPILIRLLLNLW